jgi:hypothetical protein
MDPTIVSALAAVLGSLVGGSGTIATAWITHRFQARRELISTAVLRKEDLYAEFIAETSKLIIDSLDHNLDQPTKLFQVYALLNRIRLSSSEAVVAAAQRSIQSIVEQYSSPNISADELRTLVLSHAEALDLLKEFSEACRVEIKALSSAA